MHADFAEPRGTVDPAELAKFERMAAEWWDQDGKFRPLHKLNPVRLAYIRDQAADHFDRDAKAPKPLAGLRLLDIGCGGGLFSEPMARLGATVVGADPLGANIEVARLHAERAGLAIDYRATTAEDLAAAGEIFDVVLAMEVVEHVSDVPAFLGACSRLAQPGGLARRRHDQPHAEGLCARHRRRRVPAALAAARHARLRQADPASRAEVRAASGRPRRDRPRRRHLRSARRRLEAHIRLV